MMNVVFGAGAMHYFHSRAFHQKTEKNSDIRQFKFYVSGMSKSPPVGQSNPHVIESYGVIIFEKFVFAYFAVSFLLVFVRFN